MTNKKEINIKFATYVLFIAKLDICRQQHWVAIQQWSECIIYIYKYKLFQQSKPIKWELKLFYSWYVRSKSLANTLINSLFFCICPKLFVDYFRLFIRYMCVYVSVFVLLILIIYFFFIFGVLFSSNNCIHMLNQCICTLKAFIPIFCGSAISLFLSFVFVIHCYGYNNNDENKNKTKIASYALRLICMRLQRR